MSEGALRDWRESKCPCRLRKPWLGGESSLRILWALFLVRPIIVPQSPGPTGPILAGMLPVMCIWLHFFSRSLARLYWKSCWAGLTVIFHPRCPLRSFLVIFHQLTLWLRLLALKPSCLCSVCSWSQMCTETLLPSSSDVIFPSFLSRVQCVLSL